METLVLENLVSNTGHLPKYRQGHLAKIGIPVGKTILKRLMYEPLWKLGVHKRTATPLTVLSQFSY